MSQRRWLLVPLLLLAASVSGADERDDDRTWPAEPDVRVDVEIISGEIEIEAWGRNEVRVRTQGGGRDSLSIEACGNLVAICTITHLHLELDASLVSVKCYDVA